MAGGRPRAFDIGTALDQAVELFWRRGYEGTGISDLTKAIGINPAGLYNTFGNKQELFRKVLDRYAEGPARYIVEAFGQPTARATVESLLRGAAEATTRPTCPPGCLTVTGGLASSPASRGARDEMASRRKAGEVALCARLEQARTEGELPEDADTDGLGRYFATVYQGIALQAAGGATRDQLNQTIEIAMHVWPDQHRAARVPP
jgi:AcrR family transcriptional regulator